MASNPNPTLITDELWWLWQEAVRLIPGVRLGGIYADKQCYHNTVRANLNKWPGAYCVQLPLDLNHGHWDKARAIDLTMSDAEMRKRTGYLRRAALHPDDTRLYGIREFIGTLDSKNVYCLIRDTDSGAWRQEERDSTHLWHEHLSVWAKYIADLVAMESAASVLAGTTWEDYMALTSGEHQMLQADTERLRAKTQGLSVIKKTWTATPTADETQWDVATLKQILADLAELKSRSTTLTAADIQAIAKAVVDEDHARSAE